MGPFPALRAWVPYDGLGAASQRGGAADRPVLRLAQNRLISWVLEA